jgi:hypothetical protein
VGFSLLRWIMGGLARRPGSIFEVFGSVEDGLFVVEAGAMVGLSARILNREKTLREFGTVNF